MRLNTGQYISGAGHLGLIGWALLGNLFTAEPLPFEVTEVTAISSEDFAALVAPQESPDAVSDIATPETPDPDEDTPDVAATPDVAPEQVEPEVSEPAEADETPDVAELAPLPEAEITDAPPVLEPPSEDVAVLIPDTSVRPQPRPAERVAPEPVAQPEPDVRVDDVAQPETAPDETAEVPREETEETAPEEATTEIVTEAEKAAAAAPSTSKRPQTRPRRTQPTEEPVEESTETAQPDDNAVNDALAEALGDSGGTETAAAPLPNGGLSDNQMAALIRAVSNNWKVDPGARSSSAIVTVLIRLDNAGNLASSPKLVSPPSDNPAVQDAAFRAARTAIIAAARAGAFKVFAEIDSSVKEIEMNFNPEQMRIK